MQSKVIQVPVPAPPPLTTMIELVMTQAEFDRLIMAVSAGRFSSAERSDRHAAQLVFDDLNALNKHADFGDTDTNALSPYGGAYKRLMVD